MYVLLQNVRTHACAQTPSGRQRERVPRMMTMWRGRAREKTRLPLNSFVRGSGSLEKTSNAKNHSRRQGRRRLEGGPRETRAPFRDNNVIKSWPKPGHQDDLHRQKFNNPIIESRTTVPSYAGVGFPLAQLARNLPIT